MVGSSTIFVKYDRVLTLIQLESYCRERKITGVFTSNTEVLSKLLALRGNDKKTPSLDNYAGSYFYHNGLEYVFISPLAQLISIPYGKFLTRHFISKLTTPQIWNSVPAFTFEILTASNEQRIFEHYKTALFITVDIETLKEDLQIRCIGYTAVHIIDGKVQTHSCVLPLADTDMYSVAIMRKFNWELKAPKGLQNGKYDCAYLFRYNAPLFNYLWDSANLFHCWYSELPKDLAFLGAFCTREAMYWKDLADTDDLFEYYRYNALDTWTTALVIIYIITHMPEWASVNYQKEFPLVFACHLSEMTGIKLDDQQRAASLAAKEIEIEQDNISLSKMLGTYPEIFNVNSTPQNVSLRKILGCADIKGSGKIELPKIGSRHPVNKRITDKIITIRQKRKLTSTYLVAGKDHHGRILYALNPHGTDTGRLASREHHFWCGLQIQNITRGKEVKCTLIADEGFRFAEADLKQAESRDTAYISGDSNLIRAVTDSRDFHAINASSFFGVPYEDIFDDTTGKTKDKVLRDLSKRTNHGATYLMGAQVLLDTMGDELVWKAKRLLNLPAAWGLLKVTTYLLECFHKAYPTLSTIFYPGVVADVITKRLLVGATGWSRYCFADPQKDKRAKNSYCAHVPQSLNAMVLNQAYMKVFYTIAMNPSYSQHFKLIAQIHDSILFQFRVGHEYLMDMVRQCMEIPVTIKGYDGKIRTFTVPADIKAGKDGMGAIRWSETE